MAALLPLALLTVGADSAGALQYQQFMSKGQGLSAGNAKASSEAHTGNPMFTVASSNHTFCPAMASGYGGYTSQPFSNGNSTWYASCGPYHQDHTFYTGSSYRHGAVWNPNNVTFDTFEFAEADWR